MSAKMLAKLREKHLPKATDEKELQTEVAHISKIIFHRKHRFIVDYKDWNGWIKEITEYWKTFREIKFRPDETYVDVVRRIETETDDLFGQPSGCFFIQKVRLSTECKNWKTSRDALITKVPELGKGMIFDKVIAQDIEVIRSDLLRTPKLFQQSEKYLVEMRQLELEGGDIDKKIAKLRIRLRVERKNPDMKLKIDTPKEIHNKMNAIKSDWNNPEEEFEKIKKLTKNQKYKLEKLEEEYQEQLQLEEEGRLLDFIMSD